MEYGQVTAVTAGQSSNLIFGVFAAGVIGGVSLDGGRGRMLDGLRRSSCRDMVLSLSAAAGAPVLFDQSQSCVIAPSFWLTPPGPLVGVRTGPDRVSPARCA
jgi:hypothetical protein